MFDSPTCWASVDWNDCLSFWFAVSLGTIKYGVVEAVCVDDAEVDGVEADVGVDDDVELVELIVDVGLV